MKVKDILAAKGSRVISIAPDDSIKDLCRLLRENHIGATIVSSGGQRIEGVISERDVAYGLSQHGPEIANMRVSALMTKKVIKCSPEDRIATVASTMRTWKIRHIPVESEDRAVGMVSIRDVLNFRVDDLQQETAQLRSFVKEVERPLQDRE